MSKNQLIKSPLNYIGGKFKLLPQILPYFPNKITEFYDVFGGGFNVGVNVEAETIYYNDNNLYVKNLLEYFKTKTIEEILMEMESLIKHYGLSKDNQKAFLNLRQDFNEKKYVFDQNIMFYGLICFGFNHNIRFNNKGEFNIPFGKGRSGFNQSLKEKLIEFKNKIDNLNVKFISQDFEKIIEEIISKNNNQKKKANFSQKDFQDVFCYFDPPYLITQANYGHNIWLEKDEERLLKGLKLLDEHNIKFALSNVVEHKGSKNTFLLKWIEQNQFNIHYLNFNYNNTNPTAKKAKENITKEVLVTNY